MSKIVKSGSPSVRPIVTGPQYYQIAFGYLHHTLTRAIEESLLVRPRTIRATALLKVVQQNTVLDGPIIWAQVRTVLDSIELEMKNALRHRSVGFWLHLYRRIGVHLDSRHEDRTDPRTTALVREIVELAVFKYGRLGEASELSLSTQVHIDQVLGGVLRTALQSASPHNFRATCRGMATYLKAAPQWVIK